MSAKPWRDPVVRELMDWRETFDCYLHDLRVDLSKLAGEKPSRLPQSRRLALYAELVRAETAFKNAAAIVQRAFDSAS